MKTPSGYPVSIRFGPWLVSLINVGGNWNCCTTSSTHSLGQSWMLPYMIIRGKTGLMTKRKLRKEWRRPSCQNPAKKCPCSPSPSSQTAPARADQAWWNGPANHGFSRLREPKHFFFRLTGNTMAPRLADYWRQYYNLPVGAGQQSTHHRSKYQEEAATATEGGGIPTTPLLGSCAPYRKPCCLTCFIMLLAIQHSSGKSW